MIEIFPAKEEIKKAISSSTKKYIIPIWCEIIADLETPVSAYHKVCKDKEYGFLLESVEGGENIGRYSFIGFDPLYILKSDQVETSIFNTLNNETLMQADNPYDLLENLLSGYSSINYDIPYSPGVVGYFGYDTIRHIEPTLDKSFNQIEECHSFPEAYFMIAGSILAFDHVKHKIYVIVNMLADKTTDIDKAYKDSQDKIQLILYKLTASHNLPPISLALKDSPQDITSNISKEEWINAVNIAKEHIKAGNIFQVVLSQRFCAQRNNIDPFTIYRALRSINPSPYLYYLDFKDFQIIGSSPEIMVKCSSDRVAEIRPIAGTRKRGKTQEQDLFLEEELLNDPKERAEHIMLVDLGRNDLGKVCEYGSVKVNRLMAVEKFSHVQHIVSDVSGKLREDLSSMDLVKACFPAGTLSGAPKVRAMEIIYNLEKSARGPYGGCIGHFGFNNEVNTAITIRTMLVRDDKVFIQAGAGIVADSDPELEYQETQSKAAALIQALTRLADEK
ncbi:MAG: hypothetical protein ACD_20C00015G0004 [uncultured bacterium]|nr:MAG: hypothetical protein ACD_20C00015G0004 [uncultured bacterium]HBH19257.1 anthranilate synthase component I [Cyanobacteria bacterium UBA9579]